MTKEECLNKYAFLFTKRGRLKKDIYDVLSKIYDEGKAQADCSIALRKKKETIKKLSRKIYFLNKELKGK